MAVRKLEVINPAGSASVDPCRAEKRQDYRSAAAQNQNRSISLWLERTALSSLDGGSLMQHFVEDLLLPASQLF